MRGQDEMLRRTAVLLLSLACLSERAVGRPAPIRFLALFFLRPAAAVALFYAAFELRLIPHDVDLPRTGGPEDAVCLAAIFSALAAVFFELALGLARPVQPRIVRHSLPPALARSRRRPRVAAGHQPRGPPPRALNSILEPFRMRSFPTGMTIPAARSGAGTQHHAHPRLRPIERLSRPHGHQDLRPEHGRGAGGGA